MHLETGFFPAVKGHDKNLDDLQHIFLRYFKTKNNISLRKKFSEFGTLFLFYFYGRLTRMWTREDNPFLMRTITFR